MTDGLTPEQVNDLRRELAEIKSNIPTLEDIIQRAEAEIDTQREPYRSTIVQYATALRATYRKMMTHVRALEEVIAEESAKAPTSEAVAAARAKALEAIKSTEPLLKKLESDPDGR